MSLEIPSNYLCQITHAPMINPVQMHDCMHIYERNAIEHELELRDQCPLCARKVTGPLTPQPELAFAIRTFLKANPSVIPESYDQLKKQVMAYPKAHAIIPCQKLMIIGTAMFCVAKTRRFSQTTNQTLEVMGISCIALAVLPTFIPTKVKRISANLIKSAFESKGFRLMLFLYLKSIFHHVDAQSEDSIS